jgi:hypothetical protein
MRPIVGAVVLLACAVSSAVADDVVLRSGRTLSGRIVSENDDKIVLETSVMKMTIARTDIQEIRRGPPPKEAPPAPPPAPPPSSKKPEGRKDATPPSKKQEPKKKAPSQRARARELLAQADAIRLAPWEEGGTTRATDWPRKSYKVVAPDGRAIMRDERPTSPDGISELYVLQDTNDGHTIVWLNGAQLFYWRRLFWHADQQKWLTTSVEQQAYQRFVGTCDAVANLSCKDTNGLVAVSCAETDLKHALGKDRTSACDKERAKLREACAKATVSEEAAELLAQVCELKVDEMFAKRTVDKIAAATKCRDVLERLVETMRD